MTKTLAILAVLCAVGSIFVSVLWSGDEKSNSWRAYVLISLALSAMFSALAIISQYLVWK